MSAAKVANVGKEITLNLFTTITNANFDANFLNDRINKTLSLIPEKIEIPEKIGVLATENEDIRSLRELITYGLKGMAAYLYHANALGYDDKKIENFMQETLSKLLDDNLTAEDLTALALETGKFGVDVMSLLDKANTESYGNPEITKVNLGVGKNPGILISGHDLKDLEELLEQTQETGVDIYTHGEMLPAHYYPKFKKYKNFAEKLPKDTVILTAGCAKYKYIKLPLGDIGGTTRVLDAGQCNDSYSLALIALKLKEVFGLDDINKLPIFYNIGWYEQKAVIVLLALLYLGVKNIHLGPTLPAFLSSNVAKVLVENFGIGTISTVDEDIKKFVG